MHHGQNRETKQRKLSKRHKLNEERGKSLNLVEIGGIFKMHHWLKLGDGSLCLEEQCRLNVWANWAVARGLTTLGGLKINQTRNYWVSTQQELIILNYVRKVDQ